MLAITALGIGTRYKGGIWILAREVTVYNEVI